MKYFISSLLLLALSLTCNGQWTQLNDMPFVNDHSNGIGYNGKGYIIQGSPVDGQSQNQLWEYNPQTDSWTSLGLVPGPLRNLAIGEVMDDKFYFGFGIGRSDLWEYDPAQNTFTELPSCPCPSRAHPAFVAHDGKIYMGAGSGAGADLDDWWVFDFDTQMWSQKENIPGGERHHPYQFGIDDGIFVGGGHLSNWLKFDINTETWSEINDFPQGRVAGTQFDFDGKGFVLAGDEADHSALVNNQFLMYDPDVDEWYKLPFDLEMHRWAPSSFIIDSALYFFGGRGYIDGGDDNHVWKFDLTSINCLAPLNLFAINIQENSAELFWKNSPTGGADTLQWREEGLTTWNNVLNPQAAQLIDNLQPCTTYEFRVNSNCGPTSIFSPIASFRTKGCGTCIDVSYCNVTDEFFALNCFINSVKINNYENVSGSNEGYQEFTASNDVEVHLGDSFELEVEPGFSFYPQNTNHKIWLDFDGDGSFEDAELVVNSTQVNGTLKERIAIPLDAQAGLTRMRVTMDINPLNGPCQGTVLSDGEVEDYCLTLVDNNSSYSEEITSPVKEVLAIYPNPFNDRINIIFKQNAEINTVKINNLIGIELFSQKMKNFVVDNQLVIPTHMLNEGVYVISIYDEKNKLVHVGKLFK